MTCLDFRPGWWLVHHSSLHPRFMTEEILQNTPEHIISKDFGEICMSCIYFLLNDGKLWNQLISAQLTTPKPLKSRRILFFFCRVLLFYFILLFTWGYIMTFAKVLRVYHSWIYLLHSWNNFNMSHFSIYIYIYIYIYYVHMYIRFPPYSLSYTLTASPSHWYQFPRQDLFCLPVLCF
jgi:hypothetical protein